MKQPYSNKRGSLLGNVLALLIQSLLIILFATLFLCGWFFINNDFNATFFFVTNLILLRCQFFLEFLPLLIATIIFSITDGLVMRAIGKWQVRRESAFLFHQLSALLPKIYYCLLVIYFANPIEINPAWVFMPMLGLFAVLVNLSARQFKKYV